MLIRKPVVQILKGFFAPSILMLLNGREVFSGTSKELIDSDDSYVQKFIRGAQLLRERAESRE